LGRVLAEVTERLSNLLCKLANMVRTSDDVRVVFMAVEAPSVYVSSGTGGLVALLLALFQ
jgi:hypothetical protein